MNTTFTIVMILLFIGSLFLNYSAARDLKKAHSYYKSAFNLNEQIESAMKDMQVLSDEIQKTINK